MATEAPAATAPHAQYRRARRLWLVAAVISVVAASSARALGFDDLYYPVWCLATVCLMQSAYWHGRMDG